MEEPPNVIQPHILFAVKRANTYDGHCLRLLPERTSFRRYGGIILLRMNKAIAAIIMAAMAITESVHRVDGTFLTFAFTFE